MSCISSCVIQLLRFCFSGARQCTANLLELKGPYGMAYYPCIGVPPGIPGEYGQSAQVQGPESRDQRCCEKSSEVVPQS